MLPAGRLPGTTPTGGRIAVRYEPLLPLGVAILSLSFAPAPLPKRGRGPAVDAVLRLRAGGGRAERAGSLAEVEAAFAQALWAGEHRGKTPAWVHERLRVEVIGGGEALRLTLRGYGQGQERDALALLDLLVQKHVRDQIPLRRAIREDVKRLNHRRRGGLREEDVREALREAREATRKEEDAIVQQQPAVRRGR
jgi:hypothetical protein